MVYRIEEVNREKSLISDDWAALQEQFESFLSHRRLM